MVTVHPLRPGVAGPVFVLLGFNAARFVCFPSCFAVVILGNRYCDAVLVMPLNFLATVKAGRIFSFTHFFTS